MKKRLLITSIVMMLVVAVALGTSTYAWFTSNATVTASEVTLRAQVNGASSLGIGWLGGDAGTSIESDIYGVLIPMAPETLTDSTTLSDVLFRSATIKEEGSVEKFNSDVAASYVTFTTTAGETSVVGKYVKDAGVYKLTTDTVAQESTTYYTQNFAPIFFNNVTQQAFYVKNLSHTNDIGTITLTANFANTDVYVLTKDSTFVDGVTYYTEDGGNYTVATVTAGDDVTADTYYEKVTGDDMIRVAIFTKPASTGTNSTDDYTLLGVLGKTATGYNLVTGDYDRNTTYYVKSGDVYTQTSVDSESFATYKTAGTLYTATNTAAYGAAAKFGVDSNVKDLDHYQKVATSLTVANSLDHDKQIDIVAVIWLDGTELTDARAGELGQVSFTFSVGA